MNAVGLGKQRLRGRILVVVVAMMFAIAMSAAAVALDRAGGSAASIAAMLAIGAPLALLMAVSMAKASIRLVVPPLPPGATPRVVGTPPVVVPIILRRATDVDAALECVLGNLRHVARRPLCLLVDGADQEAAGDEPDAHLLGRLRAQVGRRFAPTDVAILARERRWDPVDRVWRGWERKRGKIEEFCRLLLGDEGTSFRDRLPMSLQGAGAFVTIDVDTRLRHDTIDRLAAGIDGDAAIAVPVIEDIRRPFPSLFERLQAPSWFRRPFAPLPGFNQTHLGHDLFYGKGLIVADRFIARTEGRISERTVLSHDHLEAVLAGAVQVPSAVVREAVPASRTQWAHRQHRWMRGDFQIAPWLADGRLSLVSRLHLLQIVCAEAAALSSVASALGALAMLRGEAAIMIASAALLLVRPAILALPKEIVALLCDNTRSWRERCRRTAAAVTGELAAWTLAIVFAPQDALLALHAGCVVSWRRIVTGRNILEWDDSQRPRSRRSLVAASGAGGPLAVAAFVAVAGAHPVSATLFALWVAAPLVLTLRPYRQGRSPARTRTSRAAS